MNGTIQDQVRRIGPREEALTALGRMEMPTRVVHRWRFTEPAALLPGGDLGTAAVATADRPVVEVRLPDGSSRQGLEVWDLAHEREPVLVSGLPGTIGPSLEDPMRALNLARHEVWLAIRVPAGVQVEGPVAVRVQADPGSGRFAVGRMLVVLGEGARVEVEEDLRVVSGHASWVSEALVARGARLVHRRADHVAKGAAAFSRADWTLEREAFLDHGHGVFSRGVLKSEAAVVLRETGAEVQGSALIVAGERAQADWRVTVEHRQGGTRSRQTVRAAAARKARAAFTGLLGIDLGASGSEAYEEARGLLWDPTATVDLLPELEIRNHDVRCTHGAAVAPLDPEALYYLESRGLDERTARRLLTEGFLREVIEEGPRGEGWLEQAWNLLTGESRGADG